MTYVYRSSYLNLSSYCMKRIAHNLRRIALIELRSAVNGEHNIASLRGRCCPVACNIKASLCGELLFSLHFVHTLSTCPRTSVSAYTASHSNGHCPRSGGGCCRRELRSPVDSSAVYVKECIRRGLLIKTRRITSVHGVHLSLCINASCFFCT